MRVCPRCGFEAGEGSSTCPLCGSHLGSGGATGGGAPGPAATGPPAWEDPAGSFPDNLVETWRESLLEPTRFFRRVGRGTPFSRPLLYFLIVTVIGAFFTLWWQTIGLWPRGLGGGGATAGEVPAIVGFFASPFAGLIGLGLWAVVLHLFIVLFVPGRRPLAATARLLCYASGPTVFSVVPFLGPLVGLGWSVVLQVVGVREVHRTTTGRAAAAVLLPVGGAFLLLVVLLLFLVVAGLTLLRPYYP